MARSLAPTSLRALLAQETGEVMVMLATLAHPNWLNPVYVCSDILPVISNGRYFIGWRFDIQFPSDNTGELPRAQAVIDNVDPIIGQQIQAIAGLSPIQVTIEIIRHATPDVIEVAYENLKLRGVKVDDTSITGTLTYEDILNEPLTATISPSTVPGVFG